MIRVNRVGSGGNRAELQNKEGKPSRATRRPFQTTITPVPATKLVTTNGYRNAPLRWLAMIAATYLSAE